jgi:hypothetical protein
LHESFRIQRSKGKIAATVLSKLFEKDKLAHKMQLIGYRIVKTWTLPIEDIAIIGEKERDTKEYLV